MFQQKGQDSRTVEMDVYEAKHRVKTPKATADALSRVRPSGRFPVMGYSAVHPKAKRNSRARPTF